MRRYLVRLLAASAFALVASFSLSSSAQADTWSPLGPQLVGKLVSDIAVDPHSATNLAVIAGGQVYLSIDGGLLWQEQSVPYPMHVNFDPVHAGRIVVSTSLNCLEVREDDFSNWQEHDPDGASGCSASSITTNSAGTFVVTNNGTSRRLYILDRNNHLTAVSSFSDPQPNYVLADPNSSNLFVSTDTTIYRSQDQGVSWPQIADGTIVGCCGHRLAVDGDDLWTVSSNQIFYSPDAGVSWQPKNTRRYDLGFGPPLAHGGKIYVGIQNQYTGAGNIATDTTDAPASQLGLGQMSYGIARMGDSMLAGTTNGLWIDLGALPSTASIKRPVIVIPGILGSWSKRFVQGDYVLDPIKQTYTKLLTKLRSVGYSEANHTLYPFPYQWRQPDELSALDLKSFIDQVKVECSCSQVDIVAHSQGGLVAREYIEGPDYSNDINKLITLGTPNDGSINAYYLYEGGSFYEPDSSFGSQLGNNVLSTIMHLEGYLKGDSDFVDYVRSYVPSVRELLPDTSYILSRTYPDGYPTNPFLEQLNSPDKVALLKSRVKLRVIGSSSQETLSSLGVEAQTNNWVWPDGVPDLEVMSKGDGTVPLWSTSGLNQLDIDVADSDHRGLPDNSTAEVIHYLLDDDPDATSAIADASTDVPDTDPSAYSIIYAPGGHSLTVKNAAGEVITPEGITIPNADYLGSETEPQFIILRDPTAAEGQLTVTAVSDNPADTGSFPVGIIQMAEGKDDQAVEISVSAPSQTPVTLSYNQTTNTLTTPDMGSADASNPLPAANEGSSVVDLATIVGIIPVPSTPSDTSVIGRGSGGTVLADASVATSNQSAAVSEHTPSVHTLATIDSKQSITVANVPLTQSRLMAIAAAAFALALALWYINSQNS